MVNNNGLVPVLIIVGGQQGLVPLTVVFEMQYYQVTATAKRLIFSYISFVRFCSTDNTPSTLAAYAIQVPPIYACSTGTPGLPEYAYTLDFRWTVRQKLKQSTAFALVGCRSLLAVC